MDPEVITPPSPRPRIAGLVAGMILGTAGVIAIGVSLYVRATGGYQPGRRYIGTVEPWSATKIGPPRTLRVTAEVPERDVAVVAAGTPVRLHFFAGGADQIATISRTAPSSDPGASAAHIEIDVDDPNRVVPVWPTAEISLDVGQRR